MDVLVTVESWWNDEDGWLRVVAALLKFTLIEGGVSLLTVLLLNFVVTSLGVVSTLSVLPASDSQTVLSMLGFAVVYKSVSCTIVRRDEDD